MDDTQPANPSEISTPESPGSPRPKPSLLPYTTEFQDLNFLTIILRPGMVSPRLGYHSSDFSGRVFTRIVPPQVTEDRWRWTYALRQWSIPSTPQSPILSDEDDYHNIIFISISEYVHSGRTWDIYRGEILRADLSGNTTPVILKLTCLGSFPECLPENVLDWDVDTQ